MVTSTYYAETISLELGLEEAIVIKEQLIKLTGFNEDLIRIEAYVDTLPSQSCQCTEGHSV